MISANYAYVNSYSLNVRDGPSAENRIMAVLKKDTRVEIIEKRDNWWRIRSGNINGYVNAQYLRN